MPAAIATTTPATVTATTGRFMAALILGHRANGASKFNFGRRTQNQSRTRWRRRRSSIEDTHANESATRTTSRSDAPGGHFVVRRAGHPPRPAQTPAAGKRIGVAQVAASQSRSWPYGLFV